MPKEKLILDGKINKMKKNYVVSLEQHNQIVSELSTQLDQLITSLKSMDNELTKLEELFNNLEADYVEMETIIENLKNQIK
jgi:predicted  nucleic acid-binding Zn-ribbon protein